MKKILRKLVLNDRRNEQIDEVDTKLIIDNINKVIKSYHNIMIYYPLKTEPSILDIIEENPEKSFYFPCCINENDMEPRLIVDLKDLENDYKNIKTSKVKTNDEMEVVIAPAILMNYKGFRLGFGFGYYDKFLQDKKCIKIAICKECYIINAKFEDEWDIKFDYIITEKKIHEEIKNV